MLKLFITLIFFTGAVYSLASSTQSSVTIDSTTPATTTEGPTIDSLARMFNKILTEHNDLKTRLLNSSLIASTTKSPNNVQKMLGFLGRAASFALKNMANTISAAALILVFKAQIQPNYPPPPPLHRFPQSERFRLIRAN